MVVELNIFVIVSFTKRADSATNTSYVHKFNLFTMMIQYFHSIDNWFDPIA